MKDAKGGIAVSRLDERRLRAVAEAGGGRYAALAPDGSDLDALLGNRVETDHADDNPAAASDQDVESARWRDRGPWLLLLLMPLALCGFRRGWLMATALVLLAPVQQASAASLRDLWQRADQQAAAALAQGDAKQAAELARAPEWRGGASYKAGDYGAAADAYAQVGDADGVYNKGNALAKLGRYEDAIAAYDNALKLAPGMPDAEVNRKAVEDFLKQSKQDSQDEDKSSQQDSKQQQKKSGGDSQQQDGKEKSKDEQGGPKDQQDGQQQGQEAKQQDQSSGKGQDGKDPSDKDAQAAQEKQDRQSGSGADARNKAEEEASKPDVQQQQALSKEIDKALAGQPQPAGKDGKAQTGTVEEDEPSREKKQALEHWLQRVPDDPGGLLRRKFQLEYQRRQQRGGEGG
jgi:Ca-activated chloride channel family protein